MLDPVMRDAITLRDRLLSCAQEFRHQGTKATSDAGKTLAEFDAKSCEAAADMMQKLGTEVTRLRLGIQHLEHGRIGRWELVKMIDTYNGEPPESLDLSFGIKGGKSNV